MQDNAEKAVSQEEDGARGISMSKFFRDCSDCVCYRCLYYWSLRCPHDGACYDDYRAEHDPYPVHHPGKPPRTQWSEWSEPGEQEHWCRGGTLYPADECDHYVGYKGQEIKECLKANVAVFQDGYISCSLLDTYGCERCYEEFENKLDD